MVVAPSVVILGFVALVYLLYTFYLGAFFPTGLQLLVLIPSLFFLAVIALVNSIGLTLARNTRRKGVFSAAVTLTVAILLQTLSEPITTVAMRRDVGVRAQRWATDMLQRPRADIVNPTDPDYPRLKDEVIPVFMRQGYLASALCREPGDFANEPYIVVSYGRRPVTYGYYLGRTTLIVPQGGSAHVRKIVPGVYAFYFAGD